MMPKGMFLSEKCDPLGTSSQDLRADIINAVFYFGFTFCSRLSLCLS